MKISKVAPLIVAMGCSINMQAGDTSFASAFADSTLRVDFVFTGSCGSAAAPGISFTSLSKYKGWGGRKVNLDKPLREGAADVILTSMSGDTLYSNSFSTLFPGMARI